ncbi:MAG TPA: hypothetical protein VJ717_08590, partial [Gemmatimonadaceae bacterium]|nr:hypothetical protein [Gemmatimonadaceae bacterium]
MSFAETICPHELRSRIRWRAIKGSLSGTTSALQRFSREGALGRRMQDGKDRRRTQRFFRLTSTFIMEGLMN